MKPRIKIVLLLVGFICIILLSIVATTLLALVGSSTTTIYINPPEIVDPAIQPYDTISVFVMLDNIVNMKTCEFNLTFSPEILSIEQIDILELQGQYPQANMHFDDTKGYIWIKMSYQNPQTISNGNSFVEIEFYVMDYGSTDLHFESTSLIDASEQPISHETNDGFVWILKRNIIVQNIWIPYNETYVERIVSVNVTVLNDGDLLENFTVTLFADNQVVATIILSLPSGEETLLEFFWNTSEASPSLQPYVIRAEASTVPYETDVSDNTLIDGEIMLKIVGDINGDGNVDIDDLIEWDNAYGSQPGDPNWDEQADINFDEIVNKADAELILEHYRETI
ncbi:MAG: hypothetical protein JSV05_04025 [Candidatus Bathyarchaeota archaeon]|nr:MAG: hypothetical protein JSV05_04025 [Candidatus Bathyarchaeota archaeon]